MTFQQGNVQIGRTLVMEGVAKELVEKAGERARSIAEVASLKQTVSASVTRTAIVTYSPSMKGELDLLIATFVIQIQKTIPMVLELIK